MELELQAIQSVYLQALFWAMFFSFIHGALWALSSRDYLIELSNCLKRKFKQLFEKLKSMKVS